MPSARLSCNVSAFELARSVCPVFCQGCTSFFGTRRARFAHLCHHEVWCWEWRELEASDTISLLQLLVLVSRSLARNSCHQKRSDSKSAACVFSGEKRPR